MFKRNKEIKYVGEILSTPGQDDYGFIGIKTVTREDGEIPSRLKTNKDIFLHQDDCGSQLYVGMQVIFYAGKDLKRGGDSYRAFGAIEVVEGELLSDEAPVPGFYAMTKVEAGALAPIAPRSAYHLSAKEIPEEAIENVLKNQPMSEIPRIERNYKDEEKRQLLNAMLSMFFPALKQFNANYDTLSLDNDELDKTVMDNEANLIALGINSQVNEIREEVASFKGMKDTLKLIYDDGLVRPDTIIPIKYLPDLFMAVPVWYFWVKPENIENIEKVWEDNDPEPQEEIRYFCDLFPNQKWTNTYQIFNRRIRSFRQFQGDKMPPFVSQRLRKAIKAFDYIVIATPYHQEAGKDWNNLKWLQMIDPYVLGFKKGIPYFFILARFSDSGIFPLYHEMVADTINFLKSNKDKLNGFNKVSNPYWYHPNQNTACVNDLGDKLITHTDLLIREFKKGKLFEWLRNESKKNLEPSLQK